MRAVARPLSYCTVGLDRHRKTGPPPQDWTTGSERRDLRLPRLGEDTTLEPDP
jgi:hypothetical protein